MINISSVKILHLEDSSTSTHFFYYYYIGFPIAFVDLLLTQILSHIMDLPTRLVGLQQLLDHLFSFI